MATKRIAGQYNSSRTEQLREEVDSLRLENQQIAESYGALARATLEFDDRGWKPINALNEDGFAHRDVMQIAKTARLQVKSNPLLKRGNMLRSSYVFGRGFKMSAGNRDLPPRVRRIIEDPINQQVIFGEKACKRNNKTIFTDGNFFARYNLTTQRWSVIPIDEIVNFAADVDDRRIIMYFKREFTKINGYDAYGAPQTEQVVEWYPLDYVDNPVSQIGGDLVNTNYRIVDYREGHDNTSTWGVPDVLPALPWAWAYSEYLKDGSKLLKALSSIAWHVKSKTSAGAKDAGEKLKRNRGTGNTVNTTADVELNSMPRSNAVDLGTGRPLAAMAATSMEVSVDALLSEAGGVGGGGVSVLDQPTLNAAYDRQGNWEDFFVRALRLMGVANPKVTFNPIVVDPGYRNVQSLSQAWQTGLFAPEVIQRAFAESVGVDAPGAVPTGILIPNNQASEPTNVATSQGNSGPGVGDLSDGDNTLRDNQNNPR